MATNITISVPAVTPPAVQPPALTPPALSIADTQLLAMMPTADVVTYLQGLGYTVTQNSPTPPPPSTGMNPPAGYTASQKILEDSFANLTNWNTFYGPGTRWGNNGRLPSPYSGANMPGANSTALYNPSQVVLQSGGGVSLNAVPYNGTYAPQGYNWLSGCLTSKTALPSTGWYVQVSAKMPDTSAGMWPAIWALPSDSSQEIDGYEGGWPGSSPNKLGHSDTFASSGQVQRVWSTIDLTASFVTHGFQYTPGSGMSYFINGTQVYSYAGNLAQKNYYLFLQLQVAAPSTSGWHTTGGTTPQSMQIKEVQIYS